MSAHSPAAQPTLSSELRATEREVADFFGSLSPDEFVLRAGSAWTPAEHLDHLNIAVSAVARGLALPRIILRLRFGKATRPSRSFDKLRDDYRARLAAGGRAGGRFVPAVGDVAPETAGDRRAALLARWTRVNQRLQDTLHTWPERDLDRIQLPHPLLGRITTREMLYFTIYHGRHHVTAARSRLPRFTDATTG